MLLLLGWRLITLVLSALLVTPMDSAKDSFLSLRVSLEFPLSFSGVDDTEVVPLSSLPLLLPTSPLLRLPPSNAVTRDILQLQMTVKPRQEARSDKSGPL